jgi:site-specific DNA recombinase
LSALLKASSESYPTRRTDIRYKMGQKAKNGGTLGQTKPGYLNVREMDDGHEIRTVAVDTERGPFVRLAY